MRGIAFSFDSNLIVVSGVFLLPNPNRYIVIGWQCVLINSANKMQVDHRGPWCGLLWTTCSEKIISTHDLPPLRQHLKLTTEVVVSKFLIISPWIQPPDKWLIIVWCIQEQMRLMSVSLSMTIPECHRLPPGRNPFRDCSAASSGRLLTFYRRKGMTDNVHKSWIWWRT